VIKLSKKKPEKITVPTAFIRVKIETTLTFPPAFLRFTPAFVTVADAEGHIVIQQAIPIGTTQVFPLKPGLFSISASLGVVHSEGKNVEVKEGDVAQITIYFGK